MNKISLDCLNKVFILNMCPSICPLTDGIKIIWEMNLSITYFVPQSALWTEVVFYN